jgi:hypothetical protein
VGQLGGGQSLSGKKKSSAFSTGGYPIHAAKRIKLGRRNTGSRLLRPIFEKQRINLIFLNLTETDPRTITVLQQNTLFPGYLIFTRN